MSYSFLQIVKKLHHDAKILTVIAVITEFQVV
jgi:hypothetical protein